MSENKIDNVEEVIDVDAISAVEGSKVSDEELDEVVGGGNKYGFKLDCYLTYYCPYHRKVHQDIVKVLGGFQNKKGGPIYPTYYCRQAGRYYFEASNGFFDPQGRVLVKK